MTTVPATTSSTAPAVPDEGLVGLEDVDATDLVMPRLSIDHREGAFKDNLSGQMFSELNVIILGQVKQRILWDDEVNEGDKPLCKSYNNDEGHPDATRFPWVKSGFDQASVPVAEDGDIALPCATCALKEWGTDPGGKKPWCTQQHTYPLLMQVGDGGMAPALLTVQRTGIKPSNAYITSFVHANMPMYTVWTKIGLTIQKKGSVPYAVPSFTRGEETDQAFWPEYATQYRHIRGFISTPPVRSDDDGTPVAAPTAAAPAAAPTPAASAPAAPSPAAPPAAPADDDELPF